MGAMKYVITDMDDTMIVAYGKPTEPVKDCWNELSDRDDVKTVVATGQQFSKVKGTFLTNDLAMPDYIIADQGTTIFDPKRNEIIKTFLLPNDEVKPILGEFLKLGGTKPFVRIYTPEMAFAYNCPEAHQFFESTGQKNVMFGENLEYIIERGQYSKVILMNTQETVDRLVLYSVNANTLFAVNTGKTKYGNCNFFRFEIVSSDKKVALENLLNITEAFPGDGKAVNVLCLGDERSDFGLAQGALTANLYPESSGYFATIGNNTNGNVQLRAEVERLGVSLGLKDKCFSVPSVNENGWVVAVQRWLAIVDK